jgi:hypothetical protein
MTNEWRAEVEHISRHINVRISLDIKGLTEDQKEAVERQIASKLKRSDAITDAITDEVYNLIEDSFPNHDLSIWVDLIDVI